MYAIVNDWEEEMIIRNGCLIGYDEIGTRFKTEDDAYHAIIDVFGEDYLDRSCIKKVS